MQRMIGIEHKDGTPERRSNMKDSKKKQMNLDLQLKMRDKDTITPQKAGMIMKKESPMITLKNADINTMKHEQYETYELEPSASMQLDINGMQPHSREHLEYEVNCARSQRKFDMIEGEMMDYAEGIQFSGKP